MGAYNVLSAELECPACQVSSVVRVQFRFGRVFQLEYTLGDRVEWLPNQDPIRHAELEGSVEDPCPACGHDDAWQVCVRVDDHTLAAARTVSRGGY